jgi:hypothetical protein
MGNADTDNQRLLTEAQTAKYLGVSCHTLRQQRHTGPKDGRIPFIPFVKIGRNIRYDIKELEQWIKQLRVSSK